MMADLGIAEIRAEGRKMLAKYRNADGDSTDEAKAIELWFWGWVDELLRDPEVPTVEDLTAYIDMALIQWVADDYGLARHIAESIHPRLVPCLQDTKGEEG